MVYCEEKVLVKLLPAVRKNLKWLYCEGLLLPQGEYEHLFLCLLLLLLKETMGIKGKMDS